MSITAHLRTFVRGAAGTGAALGARAGGTLLVNKLVALYGGPGGLTQLAQFQNLMGLFSSLSADGIQVGLTTRLAPLPPGSRRARAWLGAAVALAVGSVLLAGGVLLVAGGVAWPVGRTGLFTAAMLLLGLQALLSTALLAAGGRRAYVGQAVALSVLGTGALAGALAANWPLPQVLLAYLAGQAATLPLAGLAARRAGLVLRWHLGPLSGTAVRGLLRFVLIAVGTLLFSRGLDYAVRAWLIAHFPPGSTDQWQAVAKLSDTYKVVVAALLSTVFYPRLAALAATPAQARHYLLVVLAVLAVALAVGFGALYALRDVLLPLLFAPRLLGARELLAPQLLGDWARFLAWVFMYQLLAQARPLPYLAAQAAATVVYGALLLYFLPRYGIRGMVLTHVAHNVLLLATCVSWYGWHRWRATLPG